MSKEREKVITKPEFLDKSEKLEEGEKNKAPSVAAKSRKRSKTQNKSIKRKNQKEDNSPPSFSKECETNLSDEVVVAEKIQFLMRN